MARSVHKEYASTVGVRAPRVPHFTDEELARWEKNLRELERRVKAAPRLGFNRPRPMRTEARCPSS